MSYNKETGMYEGYIYCITNKVNGKKYIGQTSKTISFRFQQHQYRSTNAKYTQPLYNAFKKYGIENFDVTEVVKICEINSDELSSVLNEKEIYYINTYDTKVPKGYNILNGGEENPTYLTAIPVYQFDKNGNFVKAFKSKKECAEFLGIKNYEAINRNIESKQLYRGYYWSFDRNASFDISNVKSKTKTIFQYDLNGNMIISYKSANDVDKNLGSINSIYKACTTAPHLLNGYIWLYTDTISSSEIDNANNHIKKASEDRSLRMKKNTKKVYQFTLDGQFIKEWDSISEASLYLTNGSGAGRLASVLSGVSDQAYGYLWSYTNDPPEKYRNRVDKFGKKVIQYDLNFNRIKMFSSVIEASRSVRSKAHTPITSCCKGKVHHSFGYIWRYVGENDGNPNLYYEKMGYMNPVDMFDLKGNYICTYDNMINIHPDYKASYIYRCCSGKLKKAYGHIWKFHSCLNESN